MKHKTLNNEKTADEWYEEGNAWRKQGDWQMAQNCYLKAVSLDPDNPAKTASEMLDEIMEFRYKDFYNP